MLPNPRRHFFLFVLGAVAVLALPSIRCAEASTRSEVDERVQRAGIAFRELRDVPDKRIPAELFARSRCVAVIPNVLKAAWVFGGRYGKGVLSCRSKTGEWSPPVIVLLTGGSFGLQFGASSTDVVLFFMSTGSVRSLLSNKVKLSGDAGVAAGPVGRETEAATDARFTAEIYSYARSRGLFAGVSLAGSYLGVNKEDTAVYYGHSYTPTGILFDHKVTSVPKSAWSFLNALPRARAVAKVPAPAPPPAREPELERIPAPPPPPRREPANRQLAPVLPPSRTAPVEKPAPAPLYPPPSKTTISKEPKAAAPSPAPDVMFEGPPEPPRRGAPAPASAAPEAPPVYGPLKPPPPKTVPPAKPLPPP